MEFIEFSKLADKLILEGKSAATRTAISRWYYACFHALYQFLERIEIHVPDRDQHAAIINRLIHSGNMEIKTAGNKFKELREYRTSADYHLNDSNIEKPERADKSKARSRSIIDFVSKERTEGELSDIKKSINKYLSN